MGLLPQGFGAGLFYGGSGNFFYPEPAPTPAPGKREHILEFFKTDYELFKIRSNTCTSTCRPYFMFTLEKMLSSM